MYLSGCPLSWVGLWHQLTHRLPCDFGTCCSTSREDGSRNVVHIQCWRLPRCWKGLQRRAEDKLRLRRQCFRKGMVCFPCVRNSRQGVKSSCSHKPFTV